MNWIQHERLRHQKERDAERQQADAADGGLNPYVWDAPREIPAVWNHSDLETIDREREQ